MKRRPSRRALAALGAVALAAVMIGVWLAPDIGVNSTGASPAVLKRIDQKNDKAAAEAARRMQAESRASAAIVDNLRDAEDRGAVEVNADAAAGR